MAIKQIRFYSSCLELHHGGVRRLASLALLCSAFAAAMAMAADGSPGANARYQAEKAVCTSDQSNQDRATCLKEAGAALAEDRRGRLGSPGGDYSQNAVSRCEALPADERDACQRRMQGEGMTSGSVEAGGLLREIVTPDRK